MNFGKTINELRKKKNVTQDEMAAELGVTAAAVSKWENGYTLPDILMLCSLADFFEVTTDELLGRVANWKYAVVAAETMALGEKIAALAKNYGYKTKYIFTDVKEAVTTAHSDEQVEHLLAGYFNGFSEDVIESISPLHMCQVSQHTEQEVLDTFEYMFQHPWVP